MIVNKTKNKYKIQTTMELILILSLVAIVALVSVSLYFSSLHKVSIASFSDIISAQASSSNTLILKLSNLLPSGVQIESINFTGVPSGTSISVSLENQTPVYNNGYPEYSFSVDGLSEPLTYYNITSLTYEVNGKTIVAPTITGEPIAIEETSSYISGSSSSSGSSPSSVIIAYVPITITNSYGATPAPFQQMIQIPESQFSNYISYNGNTANFEFLTQNTPNSQVLPAWIESNNGGTLTVWVKLPNGIPASSSLTIYLGFASKTTNLLSSSGTTGIGEAPQLSSTYGQYDDGASVFSLYSNFYDTLAGYSANRNAGSFKPTPSTSPYNSVELMNNTCCSGAYILSPNNINPGNYILQTYWSYSGQADGFSASLWGNSNTITSGGGGDTPGMLDGLTYHYEFYTGGGGTPPSGNPNEASVFSLTGDSAGTLITSASASGEGTYYVYSQIAFYNIGSNSGTVAIYSSSATSTSIANNIEPAELYSSTYQSTASFSSISLSASPILFSAGDGGLTAYIYIYWALMRAYPPNGVMPTVNFGSVQQTS